MTFLPICLTCLFLPNCSRADLGQILLAIFLLFFCKRQWQCTAH